MQFDTKTAADYAAQKLNSFYERASRDTQTAIDQADIPKLAIHFAELKDTVKELTSALSSLQALVDSLSYQTLPTMFENQGVKTVKIDGVGRVTINDRWSASLLDKARGLEFLRTSGNEGLIQETVNAGTLGAWAKAEICAGRPLPDDIIKVVATPYVSISAR